MARVFNALPQLRTAAPRLSKHFFTRRPCLNAALQRTFTPINVLHPPRLQSFSSTRRSSDAALRPPSKIIASLTKGIFSIQDAIRKTNKKFPNTSTKTVAYWLLGSAASVFGIVIFGGLTRLTESGLSITEWRPVTGSLWPGSPEAWQREFDKYKSSPEFAMLNSSMDLSEFKKIYFMEWAHRLWGRVIGVTFLVPTIYFIARRRVALPVAGKLVGICGLIGFQGAIGWWMVKSGLKDDLFEPGSHPRVSQYRLATHLGTAFAVYCSMLYTGLSILKEHRMLAKPSAALPNIRTLQNPKLRIFRGAALALTALIFTTAMSGALVAGLDAGLIYNEFPWMGLGLTPPKKELFDPFYSHRPDKSDLWWRNMLENPSLVQLDHRILAMTTFTAVLSLFAYRRMSTSVRNRLPNDARKGVLGLVHLVSLQVTLGISTLIYMVPTWLAAAHQAGALALLTGAVVLMSRITPPRQKIIQQIMSAPRHKPTVQPALGRSTLQNAIKKKKRSA